MALTVAEQQALQARFDSFVSDETARREAQADELEASADRIPAGGLSRHGATTASERIRAEAAELRASRPNALDFARFERDQTEGTQARERAAAITQAVPPLRLADPISGGVIRGVAQTTGGLGAGIGAGLEGLGRMNPDLVQSQGLQEIGGIVRRAGLAGQAIGTVPHEQGGVRTLPGPAGTIVEGISGGLAVTPVMRGVGGAVGAVGRRAGVQLAPELQAAAGVGGFGLLSGQEPLDAATTAATLAGVSRLTRGMTTAKAQVVEAPAFGALEAARAPQGEELRVFAEAVGVDLGILGAFSGASSSDRTRINLDRSSRVLPKERQVSDILREEIGAIGPEGNQFDVALRDLETGQVFRRSGGTHFNVLIDMENGLHGQTGIEAAARINAMLEGTVGSAEAYHEQVRGFVRPGDGDDLFRNESQMERVEGLPGETIELTQLGEDEALRSFAEQSMDKAARIQQQGGLSIEPSVKVGDETFVGQLGDDFETIFEREAGMDPGQAADAAAGNLADFSTATGFTRRDGTFISRQQASKDAFEDLGEGAFSGESMRTIQAEGLDPVDLARASERILGAGRRRQGESGAVGDLGESFAPVARALGIRLSDARRGLIDVRDIDAQVKRAVRVVNPSTGEVLDTFEAPKPVTGRGGLTSTFHRDLTDQAQAKHGRMITVGEDGDVTGPDRAMHLGYTTADGTFVDRAQLGDFADMAYEARLSQSGAVGDDGGPLGSTVFGLGGLDEQQRKLLKAAGVSIRELRRQSRTIEGAPATAVNESLDLDRILKRQVRILDADGDVVETQTAPETLRSDRTIANSHARLLDRTDARDRFEGEDFSGFTEAESQRAAEDFWDRVEEGFTDGETFFSRDDVDGLSIDIARRLRTERGESGAVGDQGPSRRGRPLGDPADAFRLDATPPPELTKRMARVAEQLGIPEADIDLARLALRNRDTRDWYESSTLAIRHYFEGSSTKLEDGTVISDADLMLNLLAVTSPQRQPHANMTLAMEGLLAIKQGQNILDPGVSGGMPTSKQMMREIQQGFTIDRWDEPFLRASVTTPKAKRQPEETLYEWQVRTTSRPKVISFFNNLQGDSSFVTNDIWIARLLGFASDNPNGAEYRQGIDRITNISKVLGWTPAEVQASLWYQSRRSWAADGMRTVQNINDALAAPKRALRGPDDPDSGTRIRKAINARLDAEGKKNGPGKPEVAALEAVLKNGRLTEASLPFIRKIREKVQRKASVDASLQNFETAIQKVQGQGQNPDAKARLLGDAYEGLRQGD